VSFSAPAGHGSGVGANSNISPHLWTRLVVHVHVLYSDHGNSGMGWRKKRVTVNCGTSVNGAAHDQRRFAVEKQGPAVFGFLFSTLFRCAVPPHDLITARVITSSIL
jgi:ribosomal protein S27AE